jgi:hypothetical protein
MIHPGFEWVLGFRDKFEEAEIRAVALKINRKATAREDHCQKDQKSNGLKKYNDEGEAHRRRRVNNERKPSVPSKMRWRGFPLSSVASKQTEKERARIGSGPGSFRR